MAEAGTNRKCCEHPGKPASAVCVAHRKCICLTCVLNNCKKCNVVELDTDAGQLISDILKALSELASASEQLKSQDATKQKIVEEIEQFYQELLTRMKKSKEAIVQDCTNKLPKQDQKEGSEIEKLEAFQKQLEAMLTRLVEHPSENIKNIRDLLTRNLRDMAPLCKKAPKLEFVRCLDYEMLKTKEIGTVLVTDPDTEEGSDSVDSEVPQHTTHSNDDDNLYDDAYSGACFIRKGSPSQSRGTSRPSSGESFEKLVVMLGEDSHHQTPCAFSKVAVHNNRLLLLDSEHQSMLVVGVNGAVIDKRPWPFTTKFMAFMSDKNIAILQEKPLIIVTFEYSGHNITEIEINKVDRDMQNVVGFDYDPSTKSFAIMSQTDILLLNIDDNRTNQIMKHTNYTTKISLESILKRVNTTVEQNHDLVRAVYMFPKRIVAFMHIGRKTIKIFDLTTDTCVRKLLDTSIQSLAISTDGYSVYVFSSSHGMQFSQNGDIVKRFKLPESKSSGALTTCFGQWNSRDVIVVTSQSDDVIRSMEITLIAK